jgi:hypothetical protein
MPFQSEKQRRYLWANEPEIARDWTDTYGSGIAKALGGRIGFRRGTSGAPGGGDPGMTSAPEGKGQTFGGTLGGGKWSPGVGGTQHIPTPRPKREGILNVKNINRAQKGLDLFQLLKWSQGGPLYNKATHGISMLLNALGKRNRNNLAEDEDDQASFDWSMFNPFGSSAHADILTKEDLEKFGADRTLSVTNPVLDDLQQYYEGAIKGPMNYTDPASIRTYMQEHSGPGQSYAGIDFTNIPETFLSKRSDFPAESRYGQNLGLPATNIGQVSPYKLFGE